MYLSLYLSICVSIYLSICITIYLLASFYLYLHLFTVIPIHYIPFISHHIFLYNYLSVCITICLHLSVFIYIYYFTYSLYTFYFTSYTSSPYPVNSWGKTATLRQAWRTPNRPSCPACGSSNCNQDLYKYCIDLHCNYGVTCQSWVRLVWSDVRSGSLYIGRSIGNRNKYNEYKLWDLI